MSSERHIIPRTVIVGSCTMVSRLLGLVREVLTAKLFGTGTGFDLFLMAFTIPNLFRRLFGEGAMHAAFIPVFTRELARSEQEGRRLFNVVMTALAGLLWGITLLGWVGCWVAYNYAGLPENGRTFCLLLAIMLPYLPLICLSALEGAALNVKGRFFLPALAPALLNVCWILAVWLFARPYGIRALAVGVVIAGVLQCGVQIPLLLRHGLGRRPSWDPANAGLRRTVQLMGPVALGIGVIQINVMVDRIIAWFCVPGDGAVSTLHYANRLMQLPLGVLGLALATAVFPSLAAQAARREHDAMVRTVGLSLRTALFMALPCMAALIALRVPMVQVLFERGQFTPDSTVHTSRALLYYSIGLGGSCCLHVVTRAFYALEDTVTPVRVAATMVAANLVLNLVLVWPMRESGLALASSITACGNVVVLLALLRRRLGCLGLRRVILDSARSLVAAALGGALGWLVWRWVAQWQGLSSRLDPTTLGIVALACGLAVTGLGFLATARALRSGELREFTRLLRRRSRDGE